MYGDSKLIMIVEGIIGILVYFSLLFNLIIYCWRIREVRKVVMVMIRYVRCFCFVLF